MRTMSRALPTKENPAKARSCQLDGGRGFPMATMCAMTARVAGEGDDNTEKTKCSDHEASTR
jgi:hypothetical protein